MAVRNRRVTENISEEVENMIENAKEGRRTIEGASERATSTALAAFDAFNGPFTKMMDQNRVIFQKMMHAMHEESLRFVNRRLEHAGRAIESSRDCQGVTGLIAVQQEFLMDMARDYAEQTRRFADLVRELAEDGSPGLTAGGAMSESFRHAAAARSDLHGEPEHRAAAE